jgi:hypothetical protein
MVFGVFHMLKLCAGKSHVQLSVCFLPHFASKVGCKDWCTITVSPVVNSLDDALFGLLIAVVVTVGSLTLSSLIRSLHPNIISTGLVFVVA